MEEIVLTLDVVLRIQPLLERAIAAERFEILSRTYKIPPPSPRAWGSPSTEHRIRHAFANHAPSTATLFAYMIRGRPPTLLPPRHCPVIEASLRCRLPAQTPLFMLKISRAAITSPQSTVTRTSTSSWI